MVNASVAFLGVRAIRELAATTATAMKSSVENKHLGNGDCFFLASFIVDRARCKCAGGSAVEVNIENERFTVVCSCCR